VADLSEDPEKILQHFRKETGKLDNWLWHRRIDECLKEAEEDADKAK